MTSPARNLEETGFLPEMRKSSRYSPTAQGKRCQNRRDDLTETIHRTRESITHCEPRSKRRSERAQA